MKCIIAIALMATCALAGPLSPVYVSQDTLGNYELRYELPDSSRHEESDSNGEVHGNYAFVDKEGNHHEFKYSAGRDGFLAHSASLPQAPALTPEVAHATAEFHALYDETARNLPASSEDDDGSYLKYAVEYKPQPEYYHYIYRDEAKPYEKVVLINGVPQDTEEVALAKKAHLQAYKAAIDAFVN